MSNDCPCEESLNILTNNQQNSGNNQGNLINNNINAMNNMNRTNNMMNAHNTRIVQNTNSTPINTLQNNNADMNYYNNNVNSDSIDSHNNTKKEEMTNREQIKIVLYILVALSIHEAVKYFINQSIRLNKGSSSRFLYYPAFLVFLLVLANLF